MLNFAVEICLIFCYTVVVINFINKNNIADQHVYELLCDKFQLFEGIFGASNSVLGMIDELLS